MPADPAAALQARLWDRVIDGHVMTPMQKIVGDSLRPEDRRDPEGVEQAHAELERAYALLDDHLGGAWLAGETFTLADCAAAPALHYGRVVHRWDEPGLPQPDALLRGADGAPIRRPRRRRRARVPGGVPAPLAGLRRLSASRAHDVADTCGHPCRSPGPG